MKYLTRLCVVSLLLSTAWIAPLYAEGFTARGGDVIGRHIFALAVDERGDPLLQDERPLIYEGSAFDLPLRRGEREFVVSGFDGLIGQLYMTEWRSVLAETIDTWPLSVANVGGISAPSAAIHSPWDSLLVSEAALIDGRHSDAFVDVFSAYYKGDRSRVKPYNYGWVDEIILLDDKGQAKVIKNYAMGRVFASHILLMPDATTFYLLDARHSGNLYMFIAEQPGSLAKGELYVMTQDGDGIKPRSLGKVSALKMKFKLKKLSFSSMFDSHEPQQGHCHEGFKHVQTVYGEECLKPKSRLRRYAGLFEPLRVMALRGISGLSRNFINMSLDEQNAGLIMQDRDGQSHRFPLGHLAGMNSNYVIKESL